MTLLLAPLACAFPILRAAMRHRLRASKQGTFATASCQGLAQDALGIVLVLF